MPLFLLGAWKWLVSTKIGRTVGIVALLSAALTGMYLVAYHRGNSHGDKVARAAVVADADRAVQQNASQFTAILKDAETAINRANETINAQSAKIDDANAKLQTLRAQRQAQKQQVTSLPDAEVPHDLRKKLGMVQDSDPAPLTPQELRAADEQVSQYQNMTQQNAVMASKLDAMDHKIDGLNTKVEGITRQRDAAISAYNGLMPYYVQAFNASQGKSTWIVRAAAKLHLHKDKHIKLPDPVTLPKLEAPGQ